MGPFQLCSPDEMAEIRYKIEREVLDTPSAIYGFETGRDRHLDCRVLYDLIAHSAIKERLVQILGPDLLVWRSNFFFKPPGAPETVWHKENVFKEFVDRPILEPPDPEAFFQVTPWIAIDEATLENGCVQLVAGTHKLLGKIGNGEQAKEEADREKQSFGHDKPGFFGYNLKPNFEVDPSKVVSMECKAGEFFIFDQRTIHGSPPNKSNKRRLGINFRVIQTNVKVFEHYLAQGKIEHYGMTFDLTKWGCILLSGEERFHFNKMAEPPH